MLDHDGFVAGDLVSNVFVRDESGPIATPAPTHALDGITHHPVMEVGSSEGYDIVGAELTPADLFGAADVFLTTSARGIVSMAAINGQDIGGGSPSTAVLDLTSATLEHARTTATTPME